ncbi:MAG: DUF3105 domain-containing protein [Mycobacteriales bacterium]
MAPKLGPQKRSRSRKQSGTTPKAEGDATQQPPPSDTPAEEPATELQGKAVELTSAAKPAADEPEAAMEEQSSQHPTPRRTERERGSGQSSKRGSSRTHPGKGRPNRTGRGRDRKGRPVTVAKAGRVATSTIAMFVVVGLIALGIIGYGIYHAWDANRPFGQQRAQQIDGVTNYRDKDSKMLTRNHVLGTVNHKTSPPVGGNHNSVWETCNGDVYGDQIPNEHAVHSLEHGAVWIAYRPGLPKSQVEKLAKKVRGEDYMLMSPYPGLKSAVSLQAWGFQLKVNSVNDSRIDKFIIAFRKKASVEPGSNCSNGVTVTGDQPVEPQDGMGDDPTVGGGPTGALQ